MWSWLASGGGSLDAGDPVVEVRELTVSAMTFGLENEKMTTFEGRPRACLALVLFKVSFS